jgi:hypothetical protein
MEALRGLLDANVVFFELLEQPRTGGEVDVLTFVVDLAPAREPARASALH